MSDFDEFARNYHENIRPKLADDADRFGVRSVENIGIKTVFLCEKRGVASADGAIGCTLQVLVSKFAHDIFA